MVYKNLHREGRSEEVLPPFFEAADYSKQFPIEYIVVSFGGGECLEEVATWLHVSIGIELH